MGGNGVYYIQSQHYKQEEDRREHALRSLVHALRTPRPATPSEHRWVWSMAVRIVVRRKGCRHRKRIEESDVVLARPTI